MKGCKRRKEEIGNCGRNNGTAGNRLGPVTETGRELGGEVFKETRADTAQTNGPPNPK